MPPPDQDRLDALLRQCVVKVVVGGSHGSGFVVGPSLVLTCRHVVVDAIDEGVDVLLHAHDDRDPMPATVIDDRGPGWPDLALLDVPDAADLPSVLLGSHAARRDAKLVVGGYPKETSVDYQSPSFTSGGQENYGSEGGPYLRLDDDRLVGGMSGAPVLDRDTGFVRAITRLTSDDRIPVGGFAVPISTVLESFGPLRRYYDVPGPSGKRWADTLGALYLRTFRRDPDGRRWDADERGSERIDLELSPSGPDEAPLASWMVAAVGHPECKSTMGTRDLDPDTDVMEAVDRWSRRRTYSRREEVELLGRLLYRWLLPTRVRELVDSRLSQGDPFLLRIRVSPKNRLAAVPWEYARLSSAAEPLSTMDSLALVRTVESPGVSLTRKERLRVLVVAICPKKVQEELPGRQSRVGGGLNRPGTGARLAPAVASSVAADRIAVTHRHDVSLDEFQRLLEEGEWDVVHYVGFGWDWEDGDEPALAFVENRTMQPIPLSTVGAALASSQAPIVVVQLLPLPLKDSTPPLNETGLLPLLSGAVQGLVVAENVQTDSHATTFTSRFYASLARGESVETATQAGRRGLFAVAPDGDHAAFGAVTVTTTQEGDLRPLTRVTLPGAAGSDYSAHGSSSAPRRGR